MNMDVTAGEDRRGVRRVFGNLDQWLCGYWLPAGLLIFLTGFFWAPSRHNLKTIVYLMLLLPALLSLLQWRRLRRLLTESPLPALVAVYLLYLTGTAWWHGQEEAAAFLKWSFFIVLFVWAVGGAMAIDERRLTRLLGCAALVAGVGAVVAIGRDFAAGLIDEAGYRLVGYGAFYNPLRSGHLFGAFAVIAAWSAALEQRRGWRVALALAAAACLAAAVLTGSRAPLLAMLGTALVVTMDMRGRLRWVSLLLVVALALAVGVLFWGPLSERGWSLRPEIWAASLGIWLERPWFGAGLGASLAIPVSTGDVYIDTHNVFLAVLFYGGVVGLMLFAAVFGFTLIAGWRARRRAPLGYLAVALLGFGLLTLQFDGGGVLSRPNEFWVLLWLPVALCIRAGAAACPRRVAGITAH